MNGVLKIAIALFVLSLVASGCSNSSGTASVASTTALRGSYIASLNGVSYALVFDSRGCMFGTDANYNPASRVTTANWMSYGGQYSVVGTTVRVAGGIDTPYGQKLEAEHGGSSIGGNTLLLTLTNNGQSLNWTRNNGQVVEFIKQ